MIEVLGAVLPNAVAIAISPLPIIAVILMLMTPRAKQLGLGFLLGWFVGILVAVGAFTLLAGVIPEPDSSGGSQPIMGVIQLVLGALLALLAIKQWRSRPGPDDEPELPAWMSKIDAMKLPAVVGLAFALAAVNPKNLLVAAAAGGTIGRSELPLATLLVLALIFTLIAALSVAVPVVFAVVAPKKAATVLTGIRTWLTANNATIMTVVLAVLAAQVLGKGLASF